MRISIGYNWTVAGSEKGGIVRRNEETDRSEVGSYWLSLLALRKGVEASLSSN